RIVERCVGEAENAVGLTEHVRRRIVGDGDVPTRERGGRGACTDREDRFDDRTSPTAAVAVGIGLRKMRGLVAVRQVRRVLRSVESQRAAAGVEENVHRFLRLAYQEDAGIVALGVDVCDRDADNGCHGGCSSGVVAVKVPKDRHSESSVETGAFSVSYKAHCVLCQAPRITACPPSHTMGISIRTLDTRCLIFPCKIPANSLQNLSLDSALSPGSCLAPPKTGSSADCAGLRNAECSPRKQGLRAET